MNVLATGNAQHLGEADERVGRALADHAVAGEDDRGLRLGDDLAPPARSWRRARPTCRRSAPRSASPSTCISAMFSGKSMNAPPGFSVCATLNALRTISGTISGSRICVAYLVIGWNRLHEVEDLVAFLVQPRRRALARDRHDRRAVHVGVGQAGDEVGGARPERGHANAGAAGQPAVDVGHERRALLVVRGDELDRAVEQRVHDVDVLLAGNAEDVLDAFVLEAADQELGGTCSWPARGAAARVFASLSGAGIVSP